MRSIVKASSVITMDPGRPRAEAVAVDLDSGRILTVGSVQDCRDAAPEAAVEDLGSAVLMPGFIQTHDHPVPAAVLCQQPAHWIAPVHGLPLLGGTSRPSSPGFAHRPGRTAAAVLRAGPVAAVHPDAGSHQSGPLFPRQPGPHPGHHRACAVLQLPGDAGVRLEQRGTARRHPRCAVDPPARRQRRRRRFRDPGVHDGPRGVPARCHPSPLVNLGAWYSTLARNGFTAACDMAFVSKLRAPLEALAGLPGCPLRYSLYQTTYDTGAHSPMDFGDLAPMIQRVGYKIWMDGSPSIGTAAISVPLS